MRTQKPFELHFWVVESGQSASNVQSDVAAAMTARVSTTILIDIYYIKDNMNNLILKYSTISARSVNPIKHVLGV